MTPSSLGPNGAGPTVDVAGPTEEPISPAEILMTILQGAVDPRIVDPADIVVGPAGHDQQQRGCVQITDGGTSDVKRGVPIVFARIQLRILAHTPDASDRIGYHIRYVANGRHREVVTVPSTGDKYLVHRTNVLAGPSAHYDSQVTWENLMFIQCDIGLVPVAVGP